MARWRKRAAADIPAWVFDPDLAGESMAWLDNLRRRDPDLWFEALTTVLSTPAYSRHDGPA